MLGLADFCCRAGKDGTVGYADFVLYPTFVYEADMGRVGAGLARKLLASMS